MEAPILNHANEAVGSVALEEGIFGTRVNDALLWETVRMQLANRRQGTHATKTRAEVRGGGKKPWRQKGTGRARSGSSNSPVWRGGGVAFGPSPRDYSYGMPKKKRRAALCSALAAKMRDGELVVVRDLGLESISTKTLAERLQKIGVVNGLVVIPGKDERIEKSARNLATVKVLRVEGLNVYDVLKYEKLVLLESVIEKLEERL